MSDYIKLYRSLIDWEWYKNINTKVLFIHMLLKANWKDGRFEGKIIPRGSFVSSLSKLSDETDLTIREVRTAISHLENSGELTSKRHSKYSVFTIKNYDLYQGSDNQSTINRHSDDIQTTTIEEYKEIKNKRNNNIMCKKEATELFEKLWDMYPNKKGKSSVSDKDKQKIFQIGLEEMTRAIERYKKYLEANSDWLKPKNGSTFFHSGYVDYLDANYEETKIPKKKTTFNTFQHNDYDFDALEKELLSN